MNKTKIEWCDYTWNPMTGCKHRCPYCYARRICKRFGRSFEPEFHPDRLGQPQHIKKSQRIFVCDMGDLFGDWVPRLRIDHILLACEAAPQHKYLFLTKNPSRYMEFEFPDNCWLGATMTHGNDWNKIPFIFEEPRTFISFEPLLGPINFPKIKIVQWYIVGAQTKPEIQPYLSWVDTIVDDAKKHNIPVFMKDNLDWPDKHREFPKELS